MISKSKTGLLAVVVAAAIVIVGASSATANVIVNGDFEANAAGYTTFPGYDSTATPSSQPNPAGPTGWTIQSGNHGVNGLDTAATVFGPTVQAGVRDYMFLQNVGGFYSFEGQPLTLLPNQSYRLDFDAAGRDGNAPGYLGFVVNDGTGNIFDIRTSSGGSGDILVSNAAFVHYTYSFTTTAGAGPGGSLIFTNEGLNHGGGDHTVVIGNVVLNGIPEPSTVMLMALGLVGIMYQVRRRQTRSIKA